MAPQRAARSGSTHWIDGRVEAGASPARFAVLCGGVGALRKGVVAGGVGTDWVEPANGAYPVTGAGIWAAFNSGAGS